MTVALTISKSEYEALSDDLKKEYISGDDGNFKLDVTGLEDVGPLKRAKEYEVRRRKTAEEKIAELENKIVELGDNGELENRLAAGDKRIKELENSMITSAVDAEADKLASEFFTNPALGRPHLLNNLSAEIDDKGEVKIIISGKEGVIDKETLKKSFMDNSAFESIIKVSEASGGGANGATSKDKSRSNQGASGASSDDNLAKLSAKDLAARISANRRKE